MVLDAKRLVNGLTYIVNLSSTVANSFLPIFANILLKKEPVAFFYVIVLLLQCDCLWSVYHPRGAVGWPA